MQIEDMKFLFEDEKEMIWSHMFEWIQKQVLKKKIK